MKSKSSNMRKKNLGFLSLIVLFGVLVIGYFGTAFYFLNSADSYNRAVIKVRTSWVESNKDKLMYIYKDVFPKAEDCNKKIATGNCEQEIRTIIDENLATTLGYGKDEIGRQPIFFIRLKDQNTIEKLYQGGGYLEEKVDTKGEKMVVEMIQGKRNPFAYPQYNCCGGNDFVPDIPIFNLFLPIRRYLKDFPSEIEQIYLMRNEKNEIVGGLVYLYGD